MEQPVFDSAVPEVTMPAQYELVHLAGLRGPAGHALCLRRSPPRQLPHSLVRRARREP